MSFFKSKPDEAVKAEKKGRNEAKKRLKLMKN
jgi:hypothetical protein